MKKPVTKLQSICLDGSANGGFASPALANPAVRKGLVETFHSHLGQSSPAHTWPGSARLSSSPHPILQTEAHQRQLHELSNALFLSISDIIERWWKDSDARFPERMPVEAAEERLLLAMNELDTRPFREIAGSWRPDFLVEASETDPDGIENYRICEVNARFCWNAFFFSTFGQQALMNMGVGRNGLKGGTDPNKIMDRVRHLFDRNLPLHLLKGREHGYDIHHLLYYCQQSLGMRARFIRPEDLRLIPSKSAPDGNILCCVAEEECTGPTFTSESGEMLEEIYQVNLELQQDEFMSLSFEMQKQIGLRCFNDLRTILFAHDKRMLGLIFEELDNQVSRKVLKPEQAQILERGVVPTIIPGSRKIDNFIARCAQDPSLKDTHILKQVRGGKGAGILFGDLLSQSEWMSKLEPMRSPHLASGSPTYVVQRRIEQNSYEVLLREHEGLNVFSLIGTFLMINGECLGLGTWRSGPGRVCALSTGGAWMCTVMEADPLQ